MRGRGLIAAATLGFLVSIPDFRASLLGWVFMLGVVAAVLLAAATRRPRR